MEKPIEQGLMTEARLKLIETAKQNGTWTICDIIEDLTMPDDLELTIVNKKANHYRR